MKKLLSLSLAAIMIGSLAACGGSAPAPATEAPAATEAAAETEAEAGEEKAEEEGETAGAELSGDAI